MNPILHLFSTLFSGNKIERFKYEWFIHLFMINSVERRPWSDLEPVSGPEARTIEDETIEGTGILLVEKCFLGGSSIDSCCRQVIPKDIEYKNGRLLNSWNEEPWESTKNGEKPRIYVSTIPYLSELKENEIIRIAMQLEQNGYEVKKGFPLDESSCSGMQYLDHYGDLQRCRKLDAKGPKVFSFEFPYWEGRSWSHYKDTGEERKVNIRSWWRSFWGIKKEQISLPVSLEKHAAWLGGIVRFKKKPMQSVDDVTNMLNSLGYTVVGADALYRTQGWWTEPPIPDAISVGH